MKFVYALVDPRDGAVRYVGASDHPLERYKTHLGGRDTRTIAWVTNLDEHGYKPDLRILHEKSIDWNVKEEEAIRQHGRTLINRNFNPYDPWVPPATTVNEAVAQNIRKARQVMGFSQQEVAESIGVKSATITRYENGTRTPSLSHLMGLGRALSKRPIDFLPTESQIQSARQAIERGGANGNRNQEDADADGHGDGKQVRHPKPVRSDTQRSTDR